MGKDKTTHNPLGAGVSDSADSFPPQKTNSESEFSVNESLSQSAAEDSATGQQQQSGKKPRQQSDSGDDKQEGSGRSSESEFSVDRGNQDRSDDES